MSMTADPRHPGYYRRAGSLPRPIIAVIIEDETGAILADIDAGSTADALAYYLTSRRIEEVDELTIADAAGVIDCPLAPIVRESRHPLTGALERQLLARVKDS